MTQIIPERVTSLLEPVDENSAIGEDLDPDLDPYLDLQMGLESGDPDYESSVQKASTILKEHSKHLQNHVLVSLLDVACRWVGRF